MKPIPVFDHSHDKEYFPNIQSKCPMAQLYAVPTTPITDYWGKRSAPLCPFSLFDCKNLRK